MMKKLFLILLISIFISSSVFSESKHEAGNILLGVNLGGSISTEIFNFKGEDSPIGNYVAMADFGLNFDYYLSKYLSLNTGTFLRIGFYVFWDELAFADKDLWKYGKVILYLTIPVMAHFNIPILDWLYFGAGVYINIPLKNMVKENTYFMMDFSIGIPIDLGFDFIKPGRGGSRFVFRLTPEIHSGDATVVLFGFIWQIYNFKLR